MQSWEGTQVTRWTADALLHYGSPITAGAILRLAQTFCHESQLVSIHILAVLAYTDTEQPPRELDTG